MENMEEKLDSRNIKSWLIPNEVTAAIQKEDQPSPNSKQQNRQKMKGKLSGEFELGQATQARSEGLTIDIVEQHPPNSSDRDRLWGYLFANINRSIDELYQLCEEEKSVERCEEATLLLSKCQADFRNLISQINEQERFLENQTGGVSWEVRKPVYRSPQVSNGTGLPPTPTTPLHPPSQEPALEAFQLPPPHPALPPLQPPLPLPQPLALVSKLSAAAPPFLPKASQPPAMAPQKNPGNPISSSSSPSEVSVPREVALESTAHMPKTEPPQVSPSPHKALDSPIQKINPPKVEIDSQSEHDESHDERNDQSSDDREALEVAMESELLWAQTEAWVEAELIAEEEAWSHLLQPLSSDLDTDADDTDSKGTRMDEQLDTPREEEDCSSPEKRSLSLIAQETSDDQDLCPPNIAMGTRSVSIQFDPSSPLSPGLSLKSPYTSTKRRLHDKLSSPDRTGLRNQLTTEQFKLRQETKQSIAESNRDKTVREIKQKAMVASNRIKASEVKEAQRVAVAEQLYRQKLEEAEKRHSEYIKSIRGRAGNENTKVSEVLFINSLNEDALAAELQRTLEEVENRILAGRKRREELLTGISDQQRRRNRKKVEQMSELRLSLEREKMERWEKIQKRLETVRIRREERLAELQRRTLEAKEGVAANASASEPLATIETEKEDHMERLKQKKEIKKEKRKKLPQQQSVDDNAILDLYLKQRPSSVSGAGASVGLKLESQKKSPMQLDEDTVDGILQDFKLSKVPHETWSAPERAAAELEEGKGEGSRQSLHSNSNNSVKKVLLKIQELQSREILPHLTFRSDNNSLSVLDLEGKRSKRKKKLSSETLPSNTSDPSATSPNATALTSLDLSPQVDFTEALNSLDLHSQSTDNFPEIAQLLYCVLNQDFGCLSALPLLLEVTRSPTSFSPAPGLGRAHRQQDRDKDKEALLQQHGQGQQHQQQGSVLEKVMQLLCSSLHLQPTPFVGFLKSHPFAFPGPISSDTSIGSQELRSAEALFLSGTAFAVVDISRFAFVLIQKWGEKTFPLVLQHHQKQISKSLHDTSAAPNKIFWPPFILSLLPNLFSVLERLMEALPLLRLSTESREPSSRAKQSSDSTGVRWLDYFCLSGSLEKMSALFRDLQCVADFSEKDEFLSFLLCRLTQIIQRYARLLRCLTGEDAMPLANLHRVSETIQKCDLSWHLISLLGVLLLQDGLQSHSYRRLSHHSQQQSPHGQSDSDRARSFIPPAAVSALTATPHPTQRRKPSRRHSGGSSSESISVDSTHSSSPAVVLIGQSTLLVCSEILNAINQLCQLDLSLVQTLPSQMQTLTLHLTERLLSCCLAKNTTAVTAVPSVPQPSAATHSARTGRRLPAPQPSAPATGSGSIDSLGPYEQTQEQVLAQTLVFVGHLCRLCPENQTFLSSGTPPSLLVRLCNLPVNYFTEARLKQLLFPTLLSFCFENESNLGILRTELNPILLSSFLESLIKSESLAPEVSQRFPRELWGRAVEYFGKK